MTIRINGYSYSVHCEDGQEDHLHAMAADIDREMEVLKGQGSPGGEARMLVMTSLLMADKLHDTRAELDELRRSASKASQKSDAATVRKLATLAKRAEEIAASLEQP